MKTLGITLAMTLTAVAVAAAQLPPATIGPVMPPEIAAQLRQIGPVVDPPGTARIYRPLHPRAPYDGATVTRDVSYGTDPRQTMDVFAPTVAGTVPRPVLIFVSGGAGNKIEPVPDGDAFYDNIGLWAVKNGMNAVNMQRLSGQGREPDAPARDVGLVVQWVQQHIARYSGDPNRVFIWAHSAGNGPVGAYLARDETLPEKGHGLKGAVLMGGTMNILQAANVPGLLKASVPLFVGAGELDLPGAVAFVDALKNELCKANQCPTTMIFKDHSHMSAVFSPNTADDTVTAPILTWMQSVK